MHDYMHLYSVIYACGDHKYSRRRQYVLHSKHTVHDCFNLYSVSRQTITKLLDGCHKAGQVTGAQNRI